MISEGFRFYQITVLILRIRKDRPEQTVKTQIMGRLVRVFSLFVTHQAILTEELGMQKRKQGVAKVISFVKHSGHLPSVSGSSKRLVFI